jgi:cell division protein FtsB
VKKLIVLFCLVLLVFPLVMTGCGGVAESDYEAVVAERDALQAEKNALQAENDGLQAEKSALETELDATQSDVASLVAGLEKKLAALVVIDSYFSDALRYIAGEMTEAEVEESWMTFISDVGEALDDVADDELSQLWDDAEAAAALVDVDEFLSDVTDIIALLQELIDGDIAAIEARVS